MRQVMPWAEGEAKGLLIYALLCEKSPGHFYTPEGNSNDRLQMTGPTPCPGQQHPEKAPEPPPYLGIPKANFLDFQKHVQKSN